MKLSLVNIHLNSDEAMLISNGLRNNQTLETFEFRSLKGDCCVLLSGLEKHMTIKNLTIDAYQIGEVMKSLCTLLTQSRSLMKISLVNIHLNSDEQEAMLISNGLRNNQTLETVCFHQVKGNLSTLFERVITSQDIESVNCNDTFPIQLNIYLM